jgi:hypothetical protein
MKDQDAEHVAHQLGYRSLTQACCENCSRWSAPMQLMLAHRCATLLLLGLLR